MDLLIILAVLTAAIWGAVFLQKLTPLLFGILVLIVGSVFGAEFFSMKVGPLPLTIDRGLWGCLILTVAIAILKRNDGTPFHVSPIDFFLCAFLCFIGFSTMTHDWSANGNASLARFIFFQLMPISFFWIGRHLKVNEKDIFLFALLGTGFGLYLAVTGIAEKFGLHAAVFPRYIINNENVEFFGRARGPFINPIGCGIAMIFCLGCTVLLWKQVEQKWRSALAVVIGFLMLGILCTMTRSVWLSLILVAGLAVWLTFPTASRGMLISSAAVAGVLFVLVLSPYVNKFKRDKDVTADQMAQSVGLRPMLFAVAVEMAKDKPLTGHGYGQYKAAAGPYHLNSEWDMPLQKVRVYVQHNVFLAYLAELGLIGLGLNIIVMVCFLFNSFELIQRKRIPVDLRLLVLVAMFTTVAMIVNGCFHDVSLIVMVGSFYYFANGLAYSVGDQYRDESSVPVAHQQPAE